jgi:hypothetical protein
VTATFSRWTFGALACAALIGVSAFHGEARAQGYPAQVYPPSQAQQQQSANPMCGRLEAQLATIDRGNGLDPARAEQIRRFEEAVSKQQNELDRVSQQAKRMGCDSSGFFSLFSGQSAQCGPVNNQIQQMRGNLDQMTTNLERLRVGTPGSSDRDSQRRSVLMALAQNQCGPQYAAAARQQQNSGPGGFLSNLFGNNESSPGDIPPGGDMMSSVPQGTYRTVCVRTCDGFYFPISFTTVPGRFADDERACKAQCPATDANLYTYRNPGEDMNAAVSIAGQPYSSSPNAFKYRTEFNPSCSCKAQGQTWADALKTIDDSAAAQNGDIIVTEERAKRMSQPQQQKGTPAALKKNAAPEAAPAPAQPPAAQGTPGQIRQVGPQFLPNNTKQ